MTSTGQEIILVLISVIQLVVTDTDLNGTQSERKGTSNHFAKYIGS